ALAILLSRVELRHALTCYSPFSRRRRLWLAHLRSLTCSLWLAHLRSLTCSLWTIHLRDLNLLAKALQCLSGLSNSHCPCHRTRPFARRTQSHRKGIDTLSVHR